MKESDLYIFCISDEKTDSFGKEELLRQLIVSFIHRRICRVSDGAGSFTAYTYYNNGNAKAVIYPNGAAEEYSYYDNNLVNKVNGQISEQYLYTYDSAENQIARMRQ